MASDVGYGRSVGCLLGGSEACEYLRLLMQALSQLAKEGRIEILQKDWRWISLEEKVWMDP